MGVAAIGTDITLTDEDVIGRGIGRLVVELDRVGGAERTRAL